jgi:hypothetical protein
MMNDFLKSSIKTLEYYKSIADKTIAQLLDKDLFWHADTEANSIAIIMQHLSGNMLSRWTDFLTTDGEKDWRNRDSEFEQNINTKTDLLTAWEKGWACLFTTLNNLQTEDLSKTIYIRHQGQSVLEAIHRQLAHYPYHVGQIVFIGKMILKNQWQSLSIPKGNSAIYNHGKMLQEKKDDHFTDDFFEKK